MLKESGIMKEGEVSLLDFYFRTIVALEKVHVDKIVYIKSDPAILSERIHRRGRKVMYEYSLHFHFRLFPRRRTESPLPI